jgi:secretion/DNA translocation related TadE-like protein
VRRPSTDDGFTTVVTLGLLTALIGFTTLVLAVGVLRLARHRAETAADLAALAAAQHAFEGEARACVAAVATARVQQAVVDRCSLDGLNAVVVVSLPLPGPLSRFGPLHGRARAGQR